MTSIARFENNGYLHQALVYDTSGLGSKPMLDASWGVMRLSTDPLGTFTLTLKNIAVGSEYGIFRAGDNSEATLAGVAAGVGGPVAGTPGTLVDLNITLDYFTGGSANNDLRIRVRKGSASTKYIPFETLATAAAGTVLAYIAQVVDTVA